MDGVEQYFRASLAEAIVLERTGDLNKALQKTREVFQSYGFQVRQGY